MHVFASYQYNDNLLLLCHQRDILCHEMFLATLIIYIMIIIFTRHLSKHYLLMILSLPFAHVKMSDNLIYNASDYLNAMKS